MELCRWLRWKALYGVDTLSPAQLEAMVTVADSPFSCSHSGEPWGPDHEICAPEACQPGRTCFEPSRRLRRDSA